MTAPQHGMWKNWQAPAKPPVSRARQIGWRIAGALLLVLACLVGLIVGNGTADAPTAHTAGRVPTVSPAPPATHAPVVKATPHPAGPATRFGDGTWQVGKDIAAGTYSTTVPGDTFACYWARQKSATGDLSDIIANDNVPAGAHATFTVKRSDVFVTSTGCGTWVRH